MSVFTGAYVGPGDAAWSSPVPRCAAGPTWTRSCSPAGSSSTAATARRSASAGSSCRAGWVGTAAAGTGGRMRRGGRRRHRLRGARPVRRRAEPGPVLGRPRRRPRLSRNRRAVPFAGPSPVPAAHSEHLRLPAGAGQRRAALAARSALGGAGQCGAVVSHLLGAGRRSGTSTTSRGTPSAGLPTWATPKGLCEQCNHAKQALGWHSASDPDRSAGGRVTTTAPTGHTYSSTAPPALPHSCPVPEPAERSA